MKISNELANLISSMSNDLNGTELLVNGNVAYKPKLENGLYVLHKYEIFSKISRGKVIDQSYMRNPFIFFDDEDLRYIDKLSLKLKLSNEFICNKQKKKTVKI
ncbi:hypothetical protein DFLDMN_001646 [Cupriavidus sp. H19C3]|uniref:hypothetical protein n=1 Tax=Cupriavidus sp. H19C3 TaxID=3241603 RepID=UPI003BF7EF99